MSRPVISGFGRGYARKGLRLEVASAALKTRNFNALAWLAYGGRRVGVNAYAFRQQADTDAQDVHPDCKFDRADNLLLPADLPCSWREFNRRARTFFRDRVHARRLRRAADKTR